MLSYLYLILYLFCWLSQKGGYSTSCTICQSIEDFLFVFYEYQISENILLNSRQKVYQWLTVVWVIDSAKLFVLVFFVLFCWFFFFEHWEIRMGIAKTRKYIITSCFRPVKNLLLQRFIRKLWKGSKSLVHITGEKQKLRWTRTSVRESKLNSLLE